MAFDTHSLLAYSTVATAPSSPTAGTSLTIQTGDGTIFHTGQNCTVWPSGVQPTMSNAEVVRVTAISTDTLTITRAQEGSSAQSIAIGYQIANTITPKVFTDIEAVFPVSVANGGTGRATATTAYGVIAAGTTATGVQQTISPGTSGYVLTSNGASALPTFQAAASGGITFSAITTSQTAAINNGYIANSSSLITVTLPSTAAVGSVVEVAYLGTGGWKIAQAASVSIQFGNKTTTSGIGGSIASSAPGDAIRLLCVTANTGWTVLSSVGNLTVV